MRAGYQLDPPLAGYPMRYFLILTASPILTLLLGAIHSGGAVERRRSKLTPVVEANAQLRPSGPGPLLNGQRI